MRLSFLNRSRELARLGRALEDPDGSLSVVYGRRRLGKSRLIRRVLRDRDCAVVYVGDDRDARLQLADVSREIAAVLPGFDRVSYPDWSSLLDRWLSAAPRGAVLALDEFPSLVRVSPELPGLLQKRIDATLRGRHLILSGSSQRMMHGLVLDGGAPLYGRAAEIVRIEPLSVASLRKAFRIRGFAEVVDHYGAWGGVPRYWELARGHASRHDALRDLVLDPLGVLHREPDRLLRDELETTTRVASILTLIGRGAHRAFEIAGRIGVPQTSLSRPLALLVDLGLVERESPFGRSPRDAKRTRYRIRDPFLRTWFRFVEPNRSRLEAGQVDAVARRVEREWPHHLADAWEELVRSAVPRLSIGGRRWGPAARWWGAAIDKKPLELDIVAECDDDPSTMLVGEVKVRASAEEARRTLSELEAKARRAPVTRGRRVVTALFVLRKGRLRNPSVHGPGEVLGAWRE